MTRPRKDVKFNHQHRSASTARQRRPSMSVSDYSENVSEPGSPTKNGAAALVVHEPPSQALPSPQLTIAGARTTRGVRI
jgi:phosphatidate cytidylyltransferase